MARVDATFRLVRARHENTIREALRAVFRAERADAVARFTSSVPTLLSRRWDARLAEVVHARGKDLAADIGTRVAGELVPRRDELGFDPDLMDPWFDEWSLFTAEGINDSTREHLDAVDDLDGVEDVFDALLDWRTLMLAASMVTAAGNFGAQDAARGSGAQLKTWRTTSGRSRDSHAAVSGETVGLSETFSNGLLWPGDPNGGAEELANCMCVLEFVS